tara:strand:- start:1143 stop:1700 length:558 start_codon:yes stop_codon:yes gene_type:complete
MEKVGKVAYNSTAAYGRFKATTGLMLTFLISSILLSWGLFNLYTKMTTSVAVAKIIDPDCHKNEFVAKKVDNGRPTPLLYTCSLNVKYMLDKEYNSYLGYNGNKQYYKGQNIKIAYNNHDVRDIEWPVSIWLIIVPIIAAVIMFVLSYSNYYMTKTNKDYAAIKGSFDLISNLKSLTNKKNNLKK